MLHDLIEERFKKLEAIKKSGLNPYPVKTKKRVSIGEVRKKFVALARRRVRVAVSGRIVSFRDQGGVLFADLKDENSQIQLVFKKDILKNFNFIKSTLDRGDFYWALGIPFKTKKGEESLEVKSSMLLSKGLHP